MGWEWGSLFQISNTVVALVLPEILLNFNTLTEVKSNVHYQSFTVPYLEEIHGDISLKSIFTIVHSDPSFSS